jgi:septum formation protein
MLASQSPRRFDLLRQMGMTFEVEPADIDETQRGGEDAESYVLRLAQTKARAQWRSGYVNLGADTIVVLDGALLGKPQNEQHCVDMLLDLSDRTHQVATGIALFDGENTWSEVVVSSVTFRAISESEARAYWDSGEPQDKAGAYALQGLGGVFVLRIAGSHSGIIGLPMTETEQLLRAAGIQTWSELGRG